MKNSFASRLPRLSQSSQLFQPSQISDPGLRLRIGVFGGSFNPVHNGHVELARRLLELARLDEVWFVVSPQNPFKQGERLLDDALRLRMVELALAGEPRMKASDCEFGLPKPSYMWRTLQTLAEGHPGCEFVLLIGADNWARFTEWRAWRDILAAHRVVVYPREGSPLNPAEFPPGVTLADTGLVPGSSTEVRRRIACGQPIDGLVPPVVARFIKENNLYL